MSNEIIVSPQDNNRFLSPAASIGQAISRYKMMSEFVKAVLVEGRDYGKIPGTDKNTLLKPGAEKLGTLFGLRPAFIEDDKVLDITGIDHNGEAFIYLKYRCILWDGDKPRGEGLGSCNSWEKKYRYRQSERICPQCGKATIIKGKAEYGGGYICFTKKGGCGAKFQDNDARITGQPTGQVPNPDIADVINTIDKMAQKRAYIAATLVTTNASEYFTQDIEDFADYEIIEGHVVDLEPAKPQPKSEPKPAAKPAPKPVPSTVQATANGLRPDDAPVDQADLDKMSALIAKAQGIGIATDYYTVSPFETLGGLRHAYKELSEQIKSIQAQLSEQG